MRRLRFLPVLLVVGLAGCVTLTTQRPALTEYETDLTRLSLAIEAEKDIRNKCLLRLGELAREMHLAQAQLEAQLATSAEPSVLAYAIYSYLDKTTRIRQKAEDEERKLRNQMALTNALYQTTAQRLSRLANRYRSDPTLSRRLETVALYLQAGDRDTRVDSEVNHLNERLAALSFSSLSDPP